MQVVYFVLLSFSLLQAAQNHRSLYSTNYAAMSIEQLHERAQHISSKMHKNNQEWLRAQPWRKTVYAIGINSSFWLPALAVGAGGSLLSLPLVGGLCGFVAGTSVMQGFYRWYQPDQPFGAQELKDIAAMIKAKKSGDWLYVCNAFVAKPI